MFEFTVLEIGVSPTKEKVVTLDSGTKVLNYASRLTFLNQFDPTSIQNVETDSLSLETKHGIDITIHPNGAFHFESTHSSLSTISLLERWVPKIATLFEKYGPKSIEFDIDLHSHTDIKAKSQAKEIARVFTSLRTSAALKHDQDNTRYLYLVTSVKPHPSTKSMYVAYHAEFVDLYFHLKPLRTRNMKNRYLIAPAEALISDALGEIGGN